MLFLYLIRNFENIRDNGANPKFSILYENFKNDMIERLFVNLLEILRRLVYGVNLILLYPTPYIQVILNSSFSFAICYFIFILKPYKSKIDHIMNLYIEFVIFLILSIIGAFIYEDLPTQLYDITEWSLVVLIYSSIMIPALVNLIISGKDLVLFIKARCVKAPETNE